MAGFRSVKKYAEAWDAGRSYTSHYMKRSASATGTGAFSDTSMFPGNPPANYYASDPLTAATLNPLRGIYAGDDKAPARKFLTKWTHQGLSANVVGECHLLDYLLYYPFVDCDDTTSQSLDNTVTLPRYTDGEGVMVMPVCVSTGTGSGNFTFEYVNQDGVTKTSPINYCNTANSPVPGAVLSAANAIFFSSVEQSGIFCALAPGDRGVRQINSVQFGVANGGLATFVLVRRLASNALRETAVVSEVEFVTRTTAPPRVYDGAFLGLIVRPANNMQNNPISGALEFIWDEGT